MGSAKRNILTEIGNAYKALGQNQAALESYQQALAINREQGNRYQQEQTILNAIATV